MSKDSFDDLGVKDDQARQRSLSIHNEQRRQQALISRIQPAPSRTMDDIEADNEKKDQELARMMGVFPVPTYESLRRESDRRFR